MTRLLFAIIFLLVPGLAFSASDYQRIISLSPSVTEILYQMGMQDKIAAVTNVCDYPAAARQKPKVGSMVNPSIEDILLIKPDIVIMTDEGVPLWVKQRLDHLNIKIHVFRARRLQELPGAIRTLGIALGQQKNSEILAASIEQKITSLKQGSPVSKKRKKALFAIWPDPLTIVGGGTGIDDAINILGLKNIAADLHMPYPRVSLEEIISKEPDIIFLGRGNIAAEDVYRHLLKRLYMLDAVKNNRICYISDKIYRLGPRIVEGIEEMSECVKKCGMKQK
ncbi:MAG: ABC transporter substrate-binding protein [Nitrospirae bacterium]|nr:ABC transporter substrate-binding protein [Nitrospirota bacterium]